MWIMTQNGQRMINSDKAAEIFVDNTGTKICALIDKATNYSVVLGKYSTRDISKKVFESIGCSLIANVPFFSMPNEKELNDWLERQDTFVSAYLSKTFR